MGRLDEAIDFVATIVRVAYEEQIRYPAAALAYYAFVSFVPFLLLVFAVVGEQFASELSETAPSFLTPRVRDLVNRSLRTAAGRTGAGILSILVLLWTSGNVVGDVRMVVRRIEGDVQSGGWYLVRDGIVILGSLGVAIGAIVTMTILFSVAPASPLFELAKFTGLWLVLTIAFVPLYMVPSALVNTIRGALPAAVLVSFGWTALHTTIQFYAVNAGQYAIYGVLSGVIIILTSQYLAAATLLIGFIANAWFNDDSLQGR